MLKGGVYPIAFAAKLTKWSLRKWSARLALYPGRGAPTDYKLALPVLGNASATAIGVVFRRVATACSVEDFPSLIAYLAKNFGEENPIDQLPLDINTCSAAALARLPGLNSELADAIVERRKAKRGFAAVDDLLQVKGMDAGKVEKLRMYVKASN